MTSSSDTPAEYRLIRTVELPDIRSTFMEFRHEATGTRHVHIANDDPENVFAVAFKTVPEDSTGVAHILEHTVLCGSQRYPARDPFFSMIKRSLNTFMNAFTASDWTMYPFATCNRKDFCNLMDVYLDAAFFPLLDRLSFKQEGHRIEFEENGEPVFKGVVYNEMHGAMSSPSQVMERSLLHALYPSTTYRFNSGGDPAEIPRLTHEALKAFHSRHYHPSNAWFFTYGNFPAGDHLEAIRDKVLSRFTRIDPGTEVPSQLRWEAPRTFRFDYPLAAGEDPSRKFQCCRAWLTADIRDGYEVLILNLLEEILLGNAGSPLYKALIDSGLGSALSDGTGFDDDNRDTFFCCGLKDVAESSARDIQDRIDRVLTDQAEKGIDPMRIESAIHQMEFRRKEITNSPYPYGLKLLLTFCGGWFHGGDPVFTLLFDENLNRLRREIRQTPVFENRIRGWFLDNPHRADLLLAPDTGKEERDTLRIRETLQDIVRSLGPDERDRIQADADALERLQNTPEDLSCLPTLAIGDVPAEIQTTPPPREQDHILFHDMPTSGIFYVTVAADAGSVPDRLLPLVPLFCSVFTRMGTLDHDYADIAHRIDLHTGGIGLSPNARAGFHETGNGMTYVSLGAKSLNRNHGPMWALLYELIHRSSFADLDRLKQLILEYRAGMEAGIVQNGHRLAISLAARTFSNINRLNECWFGVHQFAHIKNIAREMSDDEIRRIADGLGELSTFLFRRDALSIALIGEGHMFQQAGDEVDRLVQGMPSGRAHAVRDSVLPGETAPVREVWRTSSAVSFVAKASETVRFGHPDAPVLSVIAKLIRSLFIHREIREKGGAYGGFALYNAEDGVFSLASYRDPHIVNTLRVFDAVPGFLRSESFTDEDIREAILQVCAEIDRPDTPAVAARKAFYRRIAGLSDEARLNFKKQVLSINRDRVVDTAGRRFGSDRTASGVAVISGDRQIRQANEQLGDNRLSVHDI